MSPIDLRLPRRKEHQVTSETASTCMLVWRPSRHNAVSKMQFESEEKLRT
jgi:hypothetical protein